MKTEYEWQHDAYLDVQRIHLPKVEEHLESLRWKLARIPDDFKPYPGNKQMDIKALKEKWLEREL